MSTQRWCLPISGKKRRLWSYDLMALYISFYKYKNINIAHWGFTLHIWSYWPSSLQRLFEMAVWQVRLYDKSGCLKPVDVLFQTRGPAALNAVSWRLVRVKHVPLVCTSISCGSTQAHRATDWPCVHCLAASAGARLRDKELGHHCKWLGKDFKNTFIRQNSRDDKQNVTVMRWTN